MILSLIFYLTLLMMSIQLMRHLERIYNLTLITILVCGPGKVTVVSGDKYSSTFPVENLLTQEKEMWVNTANYWLGPQAATGNFILNLGCRQTFHEIQIVNTHNAHHRGRSTKQFR